MTEREKLNGETKTCETRHEVTTTEIIVETREVKGEELAETREMGTIEGRLHDEDGVSDAHTHTRR